MNTLKRVALAVKLSCRLFVSVSRQIPDLNRDKPDWWTTKYVVGRSWSKIAAPLAEEYYKTYGFTTEVEGQKEYEAVYSNLKKKQVVRDRDYYIKAAESTRKSLEALGSN